MHLRGSRRFRLRMPRSLAAAVLVLLLLVIEAGGEPHEDPKPNADSWPRVVYPAPAAVRRARAFAAGRGNVSFAVLGGSAGTRGYDISRPFSSASASKALLLAATLRMHERERQPLDRGTRSLLESMIVFSDNPAAGSIYGLVGDAGLEDVAEHAGMRDFDVEPGFWGGAQITAADMARFYARLERNLGMRHRDYGLRLLAGITESQRWGIPAVARGSWRVWFKGGWRPGGREGTTGPVTHQAALLEHRDGERIALAILSNEAPEAGGFDVIEGVAARLLVKPPPRRGGWVAP